MPAMTFQTRVIANGQQIPASADEYDTGALCVLDGITLTWGRANQVDQPGASLARFTLATKTPDKALTAPFKVGTPIEIYTRGYLTTKAQPYLSTPSDLTRHPQGDLTQISSDPETWRHRPAKTWQSALQIDPTEPGDPADPGAWDTIRKAEGGVWRIGSSGTAPQGATITLTFLTWELHTAAPMPGKSQTFEVAGDFEVWLEDTLANVWVGMMVETRLAYQRTWEQTADLWEDHSETWETHTPAALEYTPHLISQDFTTSREVMVFQGRITDATSTTDAEGIRVPIIAGDLLAELGPTPITGSPRIAEPVTQRTTAVMDLAGIAPRPAVTLPVSADTVLVAPEKLEAAKALPLLQDCAWALGANLYTRAHPVSGQVILFEKPTERATAPITLPAGLFQQKGVSLTQDLTDTTTAVTVWYQDGDDEAAITMRDDTAPAQGVRTTEVRTKLTTRPAASLLAADWLDRLAKAPSWRLTGLTWNSESGGTAVSFEPALQILSAHTRPALPIELTNLPAWLPAPKMDGWLEGGSYSFKKNTWTLETHFTLKERTP